MIKGDIELITSLQAIIEFLTKILRLYDFSYYIHLS